MPPGWYIVGHFEEAAQDNKYGVPFVLIWVRHEEFPDDYPDMTFMGEDVEEAIDGYLEHALKRLAKIRKEQTSG